MKRYIAFIFDCYEADGGWNDVFLDAEKKVYSWDDLDEAIIAVKEEVRLRRWIAHDHWQIIDLNDEHVVTESSGSDRCGPCAIND